jgi:hypothetical protein
MLSAASIMCVKKMSLKEDFIYSLSSILGESSTRQSLVYVTHVFLETVIYTETI